MNRFEIWWFIKKIHGFSWFFFKKERFIKICYRFFIRFPKSSWWYRLVIHYHRAFFETCIRADFWISFLYQRIWSFFWCTDNFGKSCDFIDFPKSNIRHFSTRKIFVAKKWYIKNFVKICRNIHFPSLGTTSERFKSVFQLKRWLARFEILRFFMKYQHFSWNQLKSNVFLRFFLRNRVINLFFSQYTLA